MKTGLLSIITFVTGVIAGIAWQTGGTPARIQVEPKITSAERMTGKGSAATAQNHDGSEMSVPDSQPSLTSEPSGTDPFVEWEAALKLGKPLDAERRSRLISDMAAKDGARAWKMLMESGGRVTIKDIEEIGEYWGKSQGYAAATFGLTLTDPLQRSAFLRTALTAWLRADDKSFLGWFQQQPADLDLARHVNASGTIRLGGGYSRIHSHDLTVGWLEAISVVRPPDPHLTSTLSSQFENGFQDPKERADAVAWIKRQSDVEWRDAAWKGLAIGIAKKDFDAAAAILPEISDEKMRREVTSTIVAHLARTNPQQALGYASALPDERASKAAWQSALATWATHQPAESLAYVMQNITTVTPSQIERAGGSWGKSIPIEALKAVAQIPEGNGSRTEIINWIVAEWRTKHSQVASQWLASDQAAFLPEMELQRLRAESGTSGPSSAPRMGTSSMSTVVNGRRMTYFY